MDTEAIEVTDAEKRLLDERITDLEQNPGDERPFDDFMMDLHARL